jgi:hypothetical protein
MKKISNRGLLNKYNNYKKKVEMKMEPETIEPEVMVTPCPSPVLELIETIPEEINENENIISDEMVEIYRDVSVERIPTFKDIVKPPENIPSLKLIVEKILLEKRLERINGWLRR